MKHAMFSLCVGGTTLIASSATADFTGLKIESKPNEFGIHVCNVYAEFNQTGDRMVGVSGFVPNQTTIRVVDGTFFQSQFGTDRPPLGAVIDVFPTLAYDTFVTIGVKCVGDPPCQPSDALDFGDLWPGFEPGVLRLTDNFWAVTGGAAQGDPFDPVYAGGNGQALIGQFSTADGTAIEGAMTVVYLSGAGLQEQNVTFEHTVGTACFDVLDEQTVCNAAGTAFTYVVDGTESCTGTPFSFTFTGSGGAVGQELCFTVAVNDEQGGICCTAELCTTVPDCTLPGPPWDMDNDGEVGIADVLTLLGNWGACDTYCLPFDCPGDFDGDCAVEITDLLLILQNWG